MEYRVRRTSSPGVDNEILSFSTEEAAELMIEMELEATKRELRDVEYIYGDFCLEDGVTTEIWSRWYNFCVSWTRLWTAEV